MDLSTIEQKLDDSKYKTLNEVRMFTFNFFRKTVEWLLLRILPTFVDPCPSGKKICTLCVHQF